MIKNPKISVVIPIYNVEEYLTETIESVVNQTIGFEDHIQLILVNDGSPDNSELICLQYKEKYPENIIYIKQENAGVSAARNAGMAVATGEFINFLDSDDKWNLNAYKDAIAFLERHTEINLVAARLKFFEAKNGFSHPLDYKFTTDRVINIFDEPEKIQLHVSSIIIRRSCITITFDENLSIGEDAKFVNSLILQDGCYGICRSIIFNYRKRRAGNSAIDTVVTNPLYYQNTVDRYYLELLDSSRNFHARVVKYVQYVLMYDLQWRLRRPVPSDLFYDGDKNIYIESLRHLLEQIDDDIIMKQRNLEMFYKIYAFNLKNEKDVTKDLTQISNRLYHNESCIFSGNWDNTLYLFDFVFNSNNTITVSGLVKTIINPECYNIYLQGQNGEKIQFSELYDYSHRVMPTVENDHAYYQKYFEVHIPLNGTVNSYSFMFQYKDNNPFKMQANTLYLCPLNTVLKTYFTEKDGWFITFDNKTLSFEPAGSNRQIQFEKQLQKVLWQKKYKRLTLLRKLVHFIKPHLKKDIWIISDRPYKAGDNGEAFFKYLATVKNKTISPYFVIRKDSPDYKKMKKYGKVLDYNSFKYKLLFLLSAKIISSGGDDFIINPFGKHKQNVRDLFQFDFVFLQHGVTKDDISDWLNKIDKNIKLFVTVGKNEHDSILEYPYYYPVTVPKLTGFPRHDYLYIRQNETKKIIAVMPTWRHNLVADADRTTGRRVYVPYFKNSEYAVFYDGLISNQKLKDAMKTYGYKGVFYLHPSFISQYTDFAENDVFTIGKLDIDYQTVFAESALMVTDYSSVFFDFAYLKKPIVYSQFDYTNFYTNHTVDEGYFDYERDAFGPVTNDLDATVDAIIRYLENGCIMEEEYKKRVDGFFPAERGHNCENVYEAILSLK